MESIKMPEGNPNQAGLQELSQVLERYKVRYSESNDLKSDHLYSRLRQVFDRYLKTAEDQFLLEQGQENIPVLVDKAFSYLFIDFCRKAELGENRKFFGDSISLSMRYNPEKPKDNSEFFTKFGQLVDGMLKDLTETKEKLSKGDFDDYVKWQYEESLAVADISQKDYPYINTLYKILGRTGYNEWTEKFKLEDDGLEKIAKLHLDQILK